MLFCCEKFWKCVLFKMANNMEESSDCVFVVDDAKFCLHKSILASCSPVFEKMFFGLMATSDDILIEDIEVEEFKQLIDFIYNKNVEFKSVLNAWALVYIANKYLMSYLLGLCVDYIKDNLTLTTLLPSYENAELYNLEKLVTLCLRDIVMYKKGVFHTSCYHIKPSTWCAILNEKTFIPDDEELTEFAIKWATEECDLRNVKFNVENIWKILSESNLTSVLPFFVLKQESLSDEESEIFKTLQEKAIKMHCDSRIITNQKNKLHYQIRPWFKIYKNFRLRKNDILTTSVSVNAKVALFGIVVNTEHQPCNAVDESYTGGYIIEIYKHDISDKLLPIDKFTEPLTSLKYDIIHYIKFPRVVIFDQFTDYVIGVRYKNPNQEKGIEVLCHYTGTIRRSSVSFLFYNEIYGSALRGLSFYPL